MFSPSDFPNDSIELDRSGSKLSNVRYLTLLKRSNLLKNWMKEQRLSSMLSVKSTVWSILFFISRYYSILLSRAVKRHPRIFIEVMRVVGRSNGYIASKKPLGWSKFTLWISIAVRDSDYIRTQPRLFPWISKSKVICDIDRLYKFFALTIP